MASVRLVTASFDGTSKIWDAGTGKELRTLSGHSGLVFSAAFSPDGQRIVTASYDEPARVWPGAIPELQRLLSQAGTDCLPPELRRIYLDESESESQARYEACERSYGREPFFTAAP